MLLLCEMGPFCPIKLRIPSPLDNKTLCSYKNISNNMSGVQMICLEPALHCSATLKVLITVRKYLFKLILKSNSKFP